MPVQAELPTYIVLYIHYTFYVQSLLSSLEAFQDRMHSLPVQCILSLQQPQMPAAHASSMPLFLALSFSILPFNSLELVLPLRLRLAFCGVLPGSRRVFGENVLEAFLC